MKAKSILLICLVSITAMTACSNRQKTSEEKADQRIPVLFDTDANNELDDQHALAYLLLNEEVFETVGVTVNATRNGGEIGEHVKEAERVITLCGLEGKIPLLAGANGSFEEITAHIGEDAFDGHEAVDFIIREAMKERDQKLVLLPVGKLTNIALALQKEPAIADRVRVVWLGANYPDPGEYNLDNDIASMNYVLSTPVHFEMVTVRYGLPSGTAWVMVSREEIAERMPGLGPEIAVAVEGRHGDSFRTFGDYSVDLFKHIEHYEEGYKRSLFDMAAVAIVKDPSWATDTEIPCPVYVDHSWVEQPDNTRTILIWEDFDREAILADFFASFN